MRGFIAAIFHSEILRCFCRTYKSTRNTHSPILWMVRTSITALTTILLRRLPLCNFHTEFSEFSIFLYSLSTRYNDEQNWTKILMIFYRSLFAYMQHEKRNIIFFLFFLAFRQNIVVLNLFEVREYHFLTIWKICGTPKLMIQKTKKNMPRKNKYILENILLNIFKFYILKYIVKFLQSHDSN